MHQDGFLWCPYCGKPHRLGDRYCPMTGHPLDASSPPKSSHPLVDSLIDGKYRVRKRIGAGGMGEVLEAENVLLHRLVAIKVLSPKRRHDHTAIARLRRESIVLASIQHPNICDVSDVGSMPDGTPYLVLERLFGETLDQFLARRRRTALRRAVEMFSQILSGLQVAHSVGVIHRDLKPSNVFLVERTGCEPLVKLVDFRFAKNTSVDRARTITRPGQACGTPQYMSPEQLRAEPVDSRSDLFSVAVMLYEALSGTHPFSADSSTQMLINIARHEAPGLRTLRPSLPVEIERLVHIGLAKDRDDRYATAREMQNALVCCSPPDLDEVSPDSTTGSMPRIRTSSSPTSAPP